MLKYIPSYKGVYMGRVGSYSLMIQPIYQSTITGRDLPREGEYSMTNTTIVTTVKGLVKGVELTNLDATTKALSPLTVPQLKEAVAHYNVEVTTASGKDNKVIKIDYIKALAHMMKQAADNKATTTKEDKDMKKPVNVLDTLNNEQQEAVMSLIEKTIAERTSALEAKIAQLENKPANGESPKAEDTKKEGSKETPKQENKEEEKVEDKKINVTEDVQGLYNDIQAQVDELLKKAKDAYGKADISLGDKFMAQMKDLQKKGTELNRKFKDAGLATKYRNSTAYGLRKSAMVTRKYGTSIVDGLMDTANAVLGAGFQVIDTALDGTKQIVATTSDAARKVGHFSVETTAKAQEGAADLIEKKTK